MAGRFCKLKNGKFKRIRESFWKCERSVTYLRYAGFRQDNLHSVLADRTLYSYYILQT